MTNIPTGPFSEEQLKAVLARAVELDSRKAAITANDIRAIGAEVGISSASIEAALREHVAAAANGGSRYLIIPIDGRPQHETVLPPGFFLRSARGDLVAGIVKGKHGTDIVRILRMRK